MRDPLLILISGITAACLLGLQHYAALSYWQSAQRRAMPPLARYVAGVIALLAPIVLVFLTWEHMTAFDAIAAIGGTVGIGGGSVFAFYGLDWLFEQLSLWRDQHTRQ